MSNHKLGTIYKAPGVKQRADVELSLEVVNALVQTVLSGETLYPDGGLTVALPNGQGGLKTLKISRGTLNSWITRGNVIPQTGKTLKAVLDTARQDYRVKRMEERRLSMLEEAESKLHRALRIRTKVPIRNMQGKLVYNDDGSIARKEDSSLLRVQLETAKYITSRLNSEKYGKTSPLPPKPQVFSLADLRKAKQEIDAQKAKNSLHFDAN